MFSPCFLSLFPSSDRGTYRNKWEYTASCNLRLREKKLFFHDASRIRKIISSRDTDGRSCMLTTCFKEVRREVARLENFTKKSRIP